MLGAETDAPLRTAPRRFALTLGRLSVTLLPEYVVVVFAIGVFRGWLFPLGANASHWAMFAVVFAHRHAGRHPGRRGDPDPARTRRRGGAGVLGTILITLPTISLPLVITVIRDLSWRVTLATAACVATGALLWAVT